MKNLCFIKNHPKIVFFGGIALLLVLIVLFVNLAYLTLRTLRVPEIVFVILGLLVGLISGIILILGLIWGFLDFIRCSWKVYNSKAWVATEGKIIQAEINEIITDENYFCRPIIRYKYTVDGITFSCDRIAFGTINEKSPQKDYAQFLIAGNKVNVFYNPLKPSEAVLKPGFSKEYEKMLSHMLLIGTVIIIILIFILMNVFH